MDRAAQSKGYRPDTSLTVLTKDIVDTFIETGDIADSSDEERRPQTWLTESSLTVVHALVGDLRRA